MNRLALVFALAACSGGDGGLIDAGLPSDAGSLFDEPTGIVSVTSNPSFDNISLLGVFNDGPSLEVRSEMDRAGACRLMKYEPSFCDPACEPAGFCVDGECRPFPNRIDRGAIEWMWPGGQATVLPDGTNLYSESGTVTVHGETTIAVASETLSITTDDAPAEEGDWQQSIMTRSGNVALRWSNPKTGSRVRLSMTDCDGSHGGIGEFEIECEAPDSGELVLPEAFLDALDTGNWGRGECGSHNLTRYQYVDSADGTFRLETQSSTGLFYFPR